MKAGAPLFGTISFTKMGAFCCIPGFVLSKLILTFWIVDSFFGVFPCLLLGAFCSHVLPGDFDEAIRFHFPNFSLMLGNCTESIKTLIRGRRSVPYSVTPPKPLTEWFMSLGSKEEEKNEEVIAGVSRHQGEKSKAGYRLVVKTCWGIFII